MESPYGFIEQTRRDTVFVTTTTIPEFEYFENLPDEFQGWCYFPGGKAGAGMKVCVGTNKQWHCEIGPAIIWDDGSLEWWQNDKKHRLNGPAVIYNHGNIKRYYINDKSYKEKEYWKHPLIVEYKLNEIIKL